MTAAADPTGGADDCYVVVTREQRDTLLYQLSLELSGGGDVDPFRFHDSSSEFWLTVRERMDAALWLVDDLGWRRDDPRSVFYITLSRPRLERWLRSATEGAREAVAQQHECVVRARAGDEKYRWHGETLEEAERHARTLVDQELELLGACWALLTQLANGR